MYERVNSEPNYDILSPAVRSYVQSIKGIEDGAPSMLQRSREHIPSGHSQQRWGGVPFFVRKGAGSVDDFLYSGAQ